MRALFTSLPAVGHLNSILPLAIATRDAGHEVALCTSPSLRLEVERAGLDHLPGGADNLDDLFLPGLAGSAPERSAWVRLEVFAKSAPNRLMPDLEVHVRDRAPDIIVRESAEFAGCVLAERLGLPHAAVATGSWSARCDNRLGFLPSLHELRERHGLPPDPNVGMPHRYLTISLTPPSWDGAAEVPVTLHRARYVAPPTAEAFEPPDGERPLVVAALGTLFHRSEGLFEAIIEALAPLPVRAVVAVGPEADPARFASAPDNVAVVPWIPQVAALRDAALFVTHGGFNSTKEALSQGVPLVVIPLGADQFYTAERVEALGLGRSVAPDERTAATIAARVEEVLGSAAFGERTAAFAAQMAALPPLSEAVELLERLARERVPIHRALD